MNDLITTIAKDLWQKLDEFAVKHGAEMVPGGTIGLRREEIKQISKRVVLAHANVDIASVDVHITATTVVPVYVDVAMTFHDGDRHFFHNVIVQMHTQSTYALILCVASNGAVVSSTSLAGPQRPAAPPDPNEAWDRSMGGI